ncbi:Transcriptional activator protein Pur-alpha [Clonorchis sinensis]|uniref:Transcriptional activator protein Pur-alpha n=1 Tax=Clonorchis sinensis TaxID=79923 RepID=A0A8T1M6J1_CLOSI|nr:Transcriptional activator protein Pur-alpha [Clonorchis sinensis]
MNPLIYPQTNPHFPVVHYLPGAPHQRRAVHDEEDLASVALQVQRKRFYVDVKKNRRGIFMKIAEVGADGRKARILLTLNAALEIKDKLKDLIDVLDGVLKKEEASTERSEDKPEEESKFSEAANNDGLIKSHIVNYPYRRYFLDLKRNKRGHFLRLTMLSTLNRVQLAVPSQGMLDLYNAINDLLDKWWDGSEAETQKALNLPESKSLRVDNRTLYFDSSCNRYGTYLRISEVRTASRTAITIPSRALSRFRDIINGLAADLENVKLPHPPADQTCSTEENNASEPGPTANGDTPS